MNDRNPFIIRSCCCNRHLGPGEKSVPLASSSFIGLSNTRHGEINISQLNSFRSKQNLRADDLGCQADTVVPYSSNTPSMDGEADSFSSRYLHLINTSGTSSHGYGPGAGGGFMRRDRPLARNRKSESCFDLIGEARYAGLEHDRFTPTSRRPTANSVSTSRDSWTSGMSRTSATRTPTNRNACTKNRDDSKSVTAYLTPLQRKDRELKQIKKEISKLVEEVDERDSFIMSLKYDMDSDSKSMRDEMERKITEMEQALTEGEKVKAENEEEIKRLSSQLEETEVSLSQAKAELEKEKEQFKDKYLDMYIKGQRAAAFEREEELEMLASKKKEKVTARELARKLSRTETELAKWQTLKLQEAYTTPSKPESSTEVTLNFLKDSFFHFITDPLNCLQHFRAMVEIFRYSDEQRKAIRKSITESKDLKKILRRDR